MTSVNSDTASGYLHESDVRLADFIEIVEQATQLSDYPFAESINQNVVVYDGDRIRAECADDPDTRRAMQTELNKAFLDGPGIVVFKRAYPDTAVVDAATVAFNAMIAEQRALGMVSGDHYAKPGDNDRVWNALEKMAISAPDEFVDYYANDIIHMASAAWLGPGFTLTSQVNVVNPGGAAQKPHRDYHLGFMTVDQAAEYPAHLHNLSAALTLQGAIAHCDMPVESGPTMYLPNAQKYLYGYLAWWRPEFREYFEQHYVQLPLLKGDAVFFNPALFHAAGHQSHNQHLSHGQLATDQLGNGQVPGSDRSRADVQRGVPVAAATQAWRRLAERRRKCHRRVRKRLRVPHQPRPRPAPEGTDQ